MADISRRHAFDTMGHTIVNAAYNDGDETGWDPREKDVTTGPPGAGLLRNTYSKRVKELIHLYFRASRCCQLSPAPI
jgi:hypothetical protein